MPVVALLPYIAYAAVIAGSAVEITSAESQANTAHKEKESQQALLDKANAVQQPTDAQAAQEAEASLTQSRRALLASGGQTFLSGTGGAPLLGQSAEGIG